MLAFLTLLVLAAPDAGRQTSEKHGVSLFVPQGWKILKRDEGERAFVIEGPKLGPGYPRAVLWNAGLAGETTLAKVTKSLRAKIDARKDWSVTSETPKELDGFPAVRLGVKFRTGEARGRGRFTVALLGSHFYVLELSASNRNFPGRAFDRLEKSLRVNWKKHAAAGGLTLELPGAWGVDERGMFRHGKLMFEIERSDELEGPPNAKPGPKMKLLGKSRETLQAENPEIDLRMRVVCADGWRVVVVGPRPTWDDQIAVVARILKTARAPKPDGG